MATNKSKKRHKKKHIIRHDIRHDIRHEKTKKKHRHRRRHRSRSRNVSSWQNHYTYESDNVNSPSISNTTNKNDGNIVNGLRDFLAFKKDEKKKGSLY